MQKGHSFPVKNNNLREIHTYEKKLSDIFEIEYCDGNRRGRKESRE